MPTLSDRRIVAANATEPNLMAGKSLEFISENSVVRVYATASAVGMFMTVICGTEVELEDQEISGANRYPVVPDDYVVEAGAVPGERVVVKARNSTGAAITVFTRVEIIPV